MSAYATAQRSDMYSFETLKRLNGTMTDGERSRWLAEAIAWHTTRTRENESAVRANTSREEHRLLHQMSRCRRNHVVELVYREANADRGESPHVMAKRLVVGGLRWADWLTAAPAMLATPDTGAAVGYLSGRLRRERQRAARMRAFAWLCAVSVLQGLEPTQRHIDNALAETVADELVRRLEGMGRASQSGEMCHATQ